MLSAKVNELESKVDPVNATMACWGVGVQPHPNGTRWGWVSSPMLGHLTPDERKLVGHWIRCWVSSIAGKDALEKWKISFPCQESKHDRCATHMCKLLFSLIYFFPLIFVFSFHSPCPYSFSSPPSSSFVSSSFASYLFLSNLFFILFIRPFSPFQGLKVGHPER